MRDRGFRDTNPQALLRSSSRRVHRRGEPWPAKPLKSFHVDEANGGIRRVLLREPIQVANKHLADAPGANNGKGSQRFLAAFSEGSGLQNGLSEEGQQTVPASFGGALHLDDVRVLTALDQQIGSEVTN
ncbi:MAG: hypothetical protein ABJA98_10390 [Acidobacteriota bacterium]